MVMKNILQNKLFQGQNRCFWKNSLLFPMLFLLAALTGCDFFNNSMAEYFKDNTGLVEAREVAGNPPVYYKMADGTILVAPGATTIAMSLLNPRRLDFRYELTNSTSTAGTVLSRKSGLDKIEVEITGAAEGDVYNLTLAMQSPDGLRNFTPCDLRILCVSLETSLLSLAAQFDGGPAALDQPFNPAITDYTAVVPGAISEVTLEGTTVHPGASLSINGGSPVVSGLALGNNGPYVFRVTAPNRIDTRDYRVTVFRGDAAKAITAFNITGPVMATGTVNEATKTITVNVPYGTAVTTMTARASHTGVSINPDPTAAWDYTGPVSYTVTAADGSTQAYTVMVSPVPGITVSGITVEGFAVLNFGSVPASVSASAPITITISGGTVSSWYIEVNGPVSSTSITNAFNAPSVSGFYSVNVFATVGGVLYSGSFGLAVN
jgi:hypothetical protein